MPSVPLPNLGSPGSVSVGKTLLWGVVLVVAVILGWQIIRKISPGEPNSPALVLLGPWPVDPARVATRRQLIQAFDYLAVLSLGPQARFWNHRAVARNLAAVANQQTIAKELALLYEQARYTRGPEQLSPADQAAVRRYLCQMIRREGENNIS